jgi:pimeloyl-ACP methyl ester carboxylesterase
MRSKSFVVVGIIISILMLLGGLFPLSPAVAVDNPIKPIIFVHGGAGSGAQFESQAMRFAINGYPANNIFAFEYDSSSWAIPAYQAATLTRLDAFIARVKTQTGATQVYTIGHSLGTAVTYAYYFGRPDRQANTAKHIAIDGTNLPTPGGIPTLAIWCGLRFPVITMPGATNVTIPNQAHVQAATSPESFVEMYKFFTGNTPATTQVIPASTSQIELTGRAVFFPANTGVGTATLEVWKVNGATGARIGDVPEITYNLTGTGPEDGAWGPFNAVAGQNYEFVIVRAGFRPHHFYFEPYVMNDYLIRLLTSPPGGIGDQMERDLKSAALVISRNKEWWGNRGVENDILTINGTNIVNAAICPQPKPPAGPPQYGVIGIFAYDRYLNGLTDLSAPIPYFYAQTFMTGADVYMPASESLNGTISLELTPRGDSSKKQVINTLNWVSFNHSLSTPFNDFLPSSIPTPPAPAGLPGTQNRNASSSPPPPPRLSPANISLNNVSVNPGQAKVNQPVTVLANVVNSGDSSGSYNVMLRINGKVEQQRMVEVSPGTAYPVKFTVTKSEPGSYDVAIEGHKASFTVLGGGTANAPISSGLLALLVMAALVLTTAVVLILSFRRPA